jgi:glycolate oxidase iron-sulfur subunit
LTNKKVKYPQLEKFQSDVNQCMKCGLCVSWCPVYRQEKKETSVARGKNRIVKGLMEGKLELGTKFAEHLNKCTLCGACVANCPAKTNIPNVIVAARADSLQKTGIKFPFNFIYRSLLPRRVLFGNTVRAASWFQGLFMPRTKDRIRHLAFFLSALGKSRQIPEIAPRFLREIAGEVNRPPSGIEIKMKAGYFCGCMTDFVFPGTGQNIIRFLNKNGIEVIVPKSQGCCGAPVFLGAGDFETGRKFADINALAFKDVDYVITDCATCGSAIRDYAKYLADNDERKELYTKFAAKIKDISEFLVDVLKLPVSAYAARPDFKGKVVTWHDPCHLNRHMGIQSQPRLILKSIPGIEYKEMPGASECCGMAGTFSMHYYDLSRKIAHNKMESIIKTGADIVVTGCPGCQVQLLDQATSMNLPLQVMHIADMLE